MLRYLILLLCSLALSGAAHRAEAVTCGVAEPLEVTVQQGQSYTDKAEALHAFLAFSIDFTGVESTENHHAASHSAAPAPEVEEPSFRNLACVPCSHAPLGPWKEAADHQVWAFELTDTDVTLKIEAISAPFFGTGLSDKLLLSARQVRSQALHTRLVTKRYLLDQVFRL